MHPRPPPRSPLFVTWKKASRNGERRLRGCIGILEPRRLHQALHDYALTRSGGWDLDSGTHQQCPDLPGRSQPETNALQTNKSVSLPTLQCAARPPFPTHRGP